MRHPKSGRFCDTISSDSCCCHRALDEMVYIHSWQEFQDAAEALYTRSPDKARYCVKWKSSEGKLVLKVTDNTSCIKFKTNSSIFLNRFEALNLSLMEKMQNKQKREEPPPSAPAAEEVKPISQNELPNPLPAGTSSVVPTQTPIGGAGVKKKKPKKKK